MIAEKIMYHVICDGCGTDAQEGAEHGAWVERNRARFESEENGWWTDDVEWDMCPDCWGKLNDARLVALAEQGLL